MAIKSFIIQASATTIGKQLKERKVRQPGELIVATGADTLSPEMLAGALLAIIDSQDAQKRESWRKRGETFFQKA